MVKTKLLKFSLIEILVVFVVILLLISIFLPLFSSIRAKAQGVVCIFNLKQIGGITHLYTQDNRGSLPGYSALDFIGKGRDRYFDDERSWSWYYDKNTRTLTMYWTGHLAPYIFNAKDGNWNKRLEFAGYWKDGKRVYKDESIEEINAYREGYNNLKVFICPTAAKTDGLTYTLNWGRTEVHKKDRVNRGIKWGQQIASSYVALGEFFGHTWVSGGAFSEKKLTDITMPGKRILLIEGDTAYNQASQSSPPYVGAYFLFRNGGTGAKSIPNFIHDDDDSLFEGNMNVLWADIHVSSIDRNWIMDDPEINRANWHYNWKTVRATGIMDDTYKWSQ